MPTFAREAAPRAQPQEEEDKEAVDESWLIDLCPAEQKRRGNELLSLLSEGDKAPCLPNLPPAPDFLRKSEGIYEGIVSAASWDKKEDWHTYVAGDLRLGLNSESKGHIPAEQSTTYPWDMTCLGPWQDNWPPNWQPNCFGSHVPPQWPSNWEQQMGPRNGYLMDADSGPGLNREMVPYPLNASHPAFGPGLPANVQSVPVGYEGAAADEVEQGREYEILQAATVIQRMVRGVLVRRCIRRHQAAVVIQEMEEVKRLTSSAPPRDSSTDPTSPNMVPTAVPSPREIGDQPTVQSSALITSTSGLEGSMPPASPTELLVPTDLPSPTEEGHEDLVDEEPTKAVTSTMPSTLSRVTTVPAGVAPTSPGDLPVPTQQPSPTSPGEVEEEAMEMEAPTAAPDSEAYSSAAFVISPAEMPPMPTKWMSPTSIGDQDLEDDTNAPTVIRTKGSAEPGERVSEEIGTVEVAKILAQWVLVREQRLAREGVRMESELHQKDMKISELERKLKAKSDEARNLKVRQERMEKQIDDTRATQDTKLSELA